ncbi:Collagen alpha-1(VII) chain like [Melia azedarach]|uniref:Collagen alpha-1(VII) chain like n=1 Tax=Melia azedarach TaxID=155640 RepID=A0ACC1WUQ7_MELAZ|nr:Collagen alpha-1(VII) chain like [Melia azedarach]
MSLKKIKLRLIEIDSDSEYKRSEVPGENKNAANTPDLPSSHDTENDTSDTAKSIPHRSKIPMYYTRESSFEIDWIRSSMRKSELTNLRARFDIPNSVTLRLPLRGEKASNPRRGEVAIFEILLELGLRLPFQSYFVRILDELDLAPCQLVLNSWRVLVGMYVLWNKIGHGEPSISDLRRLYQVRAGPKTNPGLFYLAARSKGERPVPDFPDSNKSWKDRWLFVGGEWGQSIEVDEIQFSVPSSFSAEVSQDWAETEGKIGEKEMLRLCSEFNYKMSFWWSKHREQLFQRIDDAHRMSEFERECSIPKRDKERLQKWAPELRDQHEKHIQELQKENEYLKIQVADLDDRLAVAIQTQDEIREEANAKSYARAFFDTTTMFKNRYPQQDLSWLDQALKIVQEIQGEESEKKDDEDGVNLKSREKQTEKDDIVGDPEDPTGNSGVDVTPPKWYVFCIYTR